VLTGLIYGLMALGLSVIFGVVRVVNFAHGEFAVVAMYATYILFVMFGLDPLISLFPIALAFFAIGFFLQITLVNRFVGRSEHEQFILSLHHDGNGHSRLCRQSHRRRSSRTQREALVRDDIWAWASLRRRRWRTNGEHR
jgi:hypothetical protein